MNRRSLLGWAGLSSLGLSGCGSDGGDSTPDNTSRQFATGWTQMPPDVYNALPQVTGNDLPDVGFSSYDMSDSTAMAAAGFPTLLPTPGNQGQQPSCTAWAVGYALATTTLGYAGENLPAPVSPADLFAKVRNRLPSACTSGAYVSYAMDALVQEGVTTLDAAPYSDLQCGIATGSRVVNIDGYSRVAPGDLLALRASIASNQPLAFGMQVPDAIYGLNASNDVLRPNGAGGGHAMALVGFNDAQRMFKVINSWSTQWGAGGFCRISYDDFARYASDVCLPWKRLAARNSLLGTNTSNPGAPVRAEHIYANRYGASNVFGVGVEIGWSEPLAVTSAAINVTDSSNNILYTQNFAIGQVARGIRCGTQVPPPVTSFTRVWATISGNDSSGRLVTIGALTAPPTR
jgi:Papain family cysteine protease